MERHPIISGTPIRLVTPPASISSVFPQYHYEFQDNEVSEEAQNMYQELTEFISTNQELVLDELSSSHEDYSKGFQKALALTRLWIDSIYLKDSQHQG